MGMPTTSWLQGAASPNEKFIDDTVENINRKPGFNRSKKKKYDRDRKLEEYLARVDSQAEIERKDSGTSSQKKSDGGQKEAGDKAKQRNVNPKKNPNLDFGFEVEEGESESHDGSNSNRQQRIGEEDEYNEEQEFVSDEDGEEEEDYEEEGGNEFIPEANKQKLDLKQEQARIAETITKQSEREEIKAQTKNVTKTQSQKTQLASQSHILEDLPEVQDD